MTAVRALSNTISEAEFMSVVIDLALLRGWRVSHFRPAKTSHGWRTAITGHPGFPDLALARGGQVLLYELKRHNGRLTPDQRLWLAALGVHARCYRPVDFPTIDAELRHGPITDIGEQQK